ncbi:hypothetical protein GCM10027592_29760 [Spirosoma flavus]
MAIGDKLAQIERQNGEYAFVPISNTATCGTMPTLAQINAQIGSALASKPVVAGAVWLAQNCPLLPPPFSVTIQAEDVTTGTGSSYPDSGASGGQIRGNYGSASDFLAYTVTTDRAGNHLALLKYQTNYTDGIATGTLLVNGTLLTDFTLPALGGGKGEIRFIVPLQAGANTIRIQGKDTGNGHSFLQDSLTVSVSNLAAAAAGSTITASSTLAGYNLSPDYLINSYRMPKHGSVGWGAGEGWNSANGAVSQQWLEINFNATRALSSVTLYGVPDQLQTRTTEPGDSETFTSYGVTGWRIQVPNGSGGWTTVATVTGNTLVKKSVSFSTVQTDRFRVQFDSTTNTTSVLLVEVEAN